jgi:hypothetical protein
MVDTSQTQLKNKYLGIYAKVFQYEVGVLKYIAIGGIYFKAP